MNRKNVEGIYKLSPVQKGMLFFTLFSPERGAYFDQFILPFPRDFQEAPFRRAWQRVVDRHQVLRTSFLWEGLEEPVQVVHRKVRIEVEVEDGSHLSAEEQRRRVMERRHRDQRRGFDLTRAPAMRLWVLRISGAGAARVVWSYHHLILDGWSVIQVLQEFARLYSEEVGGAPARLPPARPFAEYLKWLRKQDLREAEAYWRRTLGDFTSPTVLAFDRGETAGETAADGGYRRERLILDTGATVRIQEFARAHRVTLLNVVQGAWVRILAAYADEEDVVYGLTVSGRPISLPGSRSIVGCFINTLPIRARLAAGDRLVPWLRRLQTSQLEMQKYEHSPLAEVQRWSGVSGDRPLFEHIVVAQHAEAETGGSRRKPGEGATGPAEYEAFERTEFPLTLEIFPWSRLRLEVGYETDRFDAADMVRLLHHLRSVLERMVEDPERLVLDLELLTTAERQQLLEWNDTAAALPLDVSFGELFADRVARHPEAVAVADDRVTISYGELRRRSERLAGLLRERGVGAGEPVALLAERSADFLVALLGIVAAGAAYLPIDPRHPAPRQLRVLGQSRARRALVAAGRIGELETALAELPAAERPEVVELEAFLADAGSAGDGGDADADVAVPPDAMAYVLYTSGSTGMPKGAMLEHRGMVNHLYAKIHDLDLGAGDVVAQTASQSFDISVWQFLAALLVGGRTQVFGDEVAHDPVRLIDAVERTGVTMLELVPSMLGFLIAELEERAGRGEGELPSFAALRWLMPTGEALPPPMCRRWLALYPRAPLVNAYGPTECSDDVSHHVIRGEGEIGALRMSIGRPVLNMQLWVVDRRFHPQPPGCPGELCVSGLGVGRGYLHAPERTAEVFVPDVLAPAFGTGAPGDRLYRTGDLARWLADGTLEYLGRRDHQVKIRGARIELGEIEAVLHDHRLVRDAVVLLREDAGGEKRLIAYAAPEEGREPEAEELRAHVEERLPPAMVPSAFDLLETLPLTANGKIDRKALAARPLPDDAFAGAVYVAPRTPTEELLAGIWSQVLEVERVGAEDNFFDLGGHSLLITQVASRIRRTLEVELPLQKLFERPTLQALAREVDAARRRGEEPPIEPVPRDARVAEEGLPLSFAQERLWFLDQLHPGSAAYNIPGALQLEGPLEPPALAAGLASISRRHEAVRTRFVAVGEEPRQVIDPPGPVPLPTIDLGALPAPVREAELRRLGVASAGRPFDLHAGPLMRATLVRLGAEEHRVLFVMHHVVSDGWSMGILLREISALYRHHAKGEEGSLRLLPELPIQYADYAVWQRRWLEAGELENQLGVWKKRLEGAPTTLELPADRPRSDLRTGAGRTVVEPLSAELHRRLQAFSRERGATLFMTLLAGFHALLALLSGQRDLLVGSPIAGRNRLEIENLIGFFVNTLVLRGDLRGEPSFAELLTRTREVTLEAFAHQDVPFEKLVDELAPERSLEQTPLFQVMMSLQDAPDPMPAVGRLRMAPMAHSLETAKFDLNVAFHQGDGGILGVWEYKAELFDRTTVLRACRRLEALLAAALDDPDRPVAELPSLAPAERQQLLREWNDTVVGHHLHTSLAALLRAQAEHTPDACAVRFEGEELSYRELHRRARRLAGVLRSLGVGPEVPVAVALERSFELVVALLGVLEAGGAYVPVDPEYPRERVAFLLDDARAGVLLTHGPVLDRLPEIGGDGSGIDGSGVDGRGGGAPRVVHLDRELPEVPAGAPPPAPIDPESLAYVIYTSGSTGRPKGAMNRHRSIVNRLLWMQEEYRLDASDRVLQKTPFSFDVSVWEFFWPLLVGARLVVARPGGHRDGRYLAELIEGEGITTLHFVPSMLRAFLDEPELDGCRAVRRVIASGEALPPELVARFEERLGGEGGPRLHNLYGPTEAAIDVTFWRCPRGGASKVPIGRPVDNTTILLLDRRGLPVPLGVAGELMIGGVQLARGYHRRPGLTAERFVPAPSFGDPSAEAGARLYRTGDLARQLADGTVEYLGRLDFQVKVRGFRIELGEIESVLAAHPEVREVAVLAREDVPGDPRLVAYVVAEEGEPPEEALREAAGERLPDYMVPSAFVFLDELPLTANGKLDRKALPAPSAARAAYVAPRTPTEEVLATLWSEVLGVERVGVGDNFFDLGGHSLLVTRVVSRIRRALGVEVAVQHLFRHPTLAELASRVETLRRSADGRPEAPPIRPLPRGPEAARRGFPLSFAQERLWFLDRVLADRATYNIPGALRLTGPLDVAAFAAAVNDVVARHEVLRTRFGERGGKPRQLIAPSLRLAIPTVDLGALPAPVRDAEVARLTAADARRPFDLAEGPLLRVTLVRSGEESHRALFAVHHVAADGWSMEILIRELRALYDLHATRETATAAAPALPELPVQYADFAVWQREWLEGGELEHQLESWRRRLAGAPTTLELPTDRPRPAGAPATRQGTVTTVLPASLQERLADFGRERGATPFMTLLAAFHAFLSRLTGRRDLLVGSPIAGRNRVEIEELIGFFVNTLVLRGELSGNPSFDRLLERTREVTLEAFAHQDVPFEKLVDEFAPRRELDQTPLFQVLFSFQQAPPAMAPVDGLRMEPAGGLLEAAKFDLNVAFHETPNGIAAVWAYRAALFDRTTVRRFARGYRALLETALADGGRHLGELPLLAPEERHQLLVEWNEPRPDYDVPGLAYRRIEERIAERPGETAVVFEGERLSYGELGERALQLGRRLRRLDVGPEVVVGVCLERSPEVLVSLLAIHRAGGAYLPLDPTYPAERLGFMVEDSGAPVVIATTGLSELLPPAPARILLDHPHPEEEPVAWPAVEPEHPAYVIYTSGSTGRPKGVSVSHRALLNRVLFDANFDLDEKSRYLQFAPFGFDMSVNQLFGPLIAGGRVVLPHARKVGDPRYLAELMASEGITHTAFPPALLDNLLEEPGLAGVGELRQVVSGGEALSPELPVRFYRRLPEVELINRYGPTEATVAVTSWTFPRGPRRRTAPIGRPMARAQIHLLDRFLEPVPAGVPGELCIGGPSLARGYHRRPGLTAERFVPAPWGGPFRPELNGGAPAGGVRLYRTGDLARHRTDGVLEFLGRVDHQVKIRGFRVELGEIEQVLRALSSVREAAVIDLPIGNSRRLVAYLVPADGAGLEPAELRAELAEELPEYMVPGAFVELDALPLTPAGKVDRAALEERAPAPESGGGGGEPRGRTEKLLAEIWCQTLGLERVGRDDNFFELGGDSILSLQIVSRANRAGLALDPQLIFRHQTVAELAVVAGRAERVEAEQGLVRGEVPATPIQRWFFGQRFADADRWNQSMMVELPRPTPLAVVEAALGALLVQHDALRLRFEAAAGHDGGAADEVTVHQRHAEPPARPPFSVVDLSALPPSARDDAFAAAADRVEASLSLAGGPIFRGVLFDREGPDAGGDGRRGLLYLAAHHLAVDGVSWRILLEDLERGLRQGAAGEPVELGPKTTSFKRWAERLVEHAGGGGARGGGVDAELPYWRRVAEAAREVPPLPFDFPAGDNLEGSLETVPAALDAERTEALLRRAGKPYRARVPELLAAALVRALARLTGGREVLLGLEGHGREEIGGDVDVSRTVGWFTAMYPLVLRAPAEGPGELLMAVKEALREVPRGGVGWGLLRHLAGDDVRAELAAAPAPPIAFNYLGQLGGGGGRETAPEGAEEPWLRLAGEPAGAQRSPRCRRSFQLAVNAVVAGGRLQMRWLYSRNLHRRSTVEALAESYLEELRRLVDHCLSPGAGGYTPSDFPLAGVDRATLERVAPYRRVGGEPEVEDLYPLSPLQEGMLFHTLYSPVSGVYFEQRSAELRGEVDAATLEAAWRLVVDRHPILRTSFVWGELERPLQRVHRQVSVVLHRHDWRRVPAEREEELLAAFLDADRERGFDLSAPPLLRLSLIRLPESGAEPRYRLVWDLHHLLTDGWSSSVLIGELFAAYLALHRGHRPAFEPARPYGDFIAWLEARREEVDDEAFWRRYLRGFDTPTPLPAARPAAELAEGEPVRSELFRPLGGDVAEALRGYARRHRLTLQTVVQAAWAFALARHAGAGEAVFGVTAAGRPPELPGVERILGVFINTLPVRVRLAEGERLVPWLQELQEEQQELRRYESTPLLDVQGWSEIGRGRALFETLFVFENYPVDEAVRESSGEMPFEIRDLRSFELTNYPLTFQVSPEADDVYLSLVYDQRHFDRTSVERLHRHLRRLLREIAGADGRRRVGDLELLGAAERHQLLREWNDTARPYPEAAATLHGLVEAQVERTPGAPAVTYEGAELDYRELDRRANRLAHHLRRLGVGLEVTVGICAERSLELMVGLLAILKAGGAYLPLDPDYPADRLAFMVGDAAVPAILTQSHLAERVAELAGRARTVLLDGELPGDDGDDARPEPLAGAENLAYTIYTSGSTGKPKGAMNRHRAIVNRLLWMQEAYRLDASDRVLQKTPMSFDVSVWELFWPLLAGARLVMARPGGHREPAYLVRTLAGEGITTLHFVPSMLQLFVEAEGVEECRSLRRVICSGEALPADLERRFFARSGARLHNLYGPTEAAVDVTYHPCDRRRRSVPIGRPIANLRIHLVDRRLRPVPIGVGGELMIGGVGLARGYLARPSLTAERFIPDPDPAAGAGARLYRSGDLVRRLADGALDFLGRIDFQVKIRGLRIELGEIEAALAEHPAVREAAVLARGEGSDRRLVGYVVPRERPPAVAELRSVLGESLPDYMVPALWVFLDELPLTPNGKLDRRALPEPEAEAAGSEAPEGPVEELVAESFAAVLGRRRAGRHDDFFELGGHSLLATRVASRLTAAFGFEVPLRALFEAPTPARLAARVDELRRRREGREVPSIVPVPRKAGQGLPLSFAQQRLWFMGHLEPDRPFYVIPAHYRVRGPLSVPVLARAATEIVRRHEVLRTGFESVAGEPVQVVHPPAPVPVAEVDLRALPPARRGSELERLAELERRTSFDLERPPLLRLRVVRLGRVGGDGGGEDGGGEVPEQGLLLTLHHVAGDGWSTGILVRELAALYPAFAAGERGAELPGLPVQYADYAVWQRGWLAGEELERQLDYWRRQLAGAPALLELPTDRPRPPMPSYRGGRVGVDLGAALTGEVEELSRRLGATPFMTLLAAFQALLGRWAGQSEVTVGTPIAGRNRAEIEELIGLFVNTLVLRGELTPTAAGEPSFTEVVARVRETTLGAYGHQELPFEKLVEELDPERSLSYTPLFQVMFLFQNVPEAGSAEAIAGTEWRELAAGSANARFDLLLTLVPAGERLVGTLTYARDLFDATTVERFARHYRRLLAAATEAPEERLGELPLLTAAEAHQLRVEWNEERPALPATGLFHGPILEHAAERPEAVAATLDGAELARSELAARSARLAAALRRRGVGPEGIVGLCLERSFEYVVAVLGVLRAGGAYLPLDPAYPAERLAYMVADSEARLVVTEERLRDHLEPLHLDADRLLLLDRLEAEPASAGSGDAEIGAEADVDPRNAAYVIYTSGSTGQPKGVVVPHRAAFRRLAHDAADNLTEPGDRFLSFSPISFDMSVTQTFSGPFAGGSTALVPPAGQRDPRFLAGFLRREGVTHAGFPPVMVEALLDQEELGRCEELREVISGGEAIPAELPERFAARLPSAALLNRYGPTEATVAVTSWTFGRGADGRRLPIGRPIAGADLHVVDARLRTQPIGVPGELLIGGHTLARGYLRRPALTAERFVPHPAAGEPGRRAYRTGDRVRQRPDGVFEFLGRIDRQVKIRGFRVELGEVESALRRLPSVDEVAVVDVAEGPTRRLVAYLVPATGAEPRPAELAAALGETLPDYMVPSAFVPLDELPRTPTGKVDRDRLPAAEGAVAPEREQVAPRDPLELELARIFEEVLGRGPVGVTDSFFELGGHSLLAIRLASAVRDRLGRELPIADFFQGPTVEALAARLRGEGEGSAPSALVPLQPAGDRPPFFCVHPVAGNALCYRGLARELGPEQPFWGLQTPALTPGVEPLETVEEMAEAYLGEIREVQPEGPYRLGGWSFGGLVAYEMARRLEAAGEEVALLALLDTLAEPEGSGRDDDEASRVLDFFAHLFRFPTDEVRELIEPLPEEDRLEALVAHFRESGHLPPDLTLETVRHHLAVEEILRRATRAYRPGPYGGQVTVFRAQDGPAGDPTDPTAGWSDRAAGVESVPVPGRHQEMVFHPHVVELAKALARHLE